MMEADDGSGKGEYGPPIPMLRGVEKTSEQHVMYEREKRQEQIALLCFWRNRLNFWFDDGHEANSSINGVKTIANWPTMAKKIKKLFQILPHACTQYLSFHHQTS